MTENKIPTWRLLTIASEKLRNIHSRKNMQDRDDAGSVTLAQARVMGCLLTSDEDGIKAKNIASELNITPGGITQIVDALVQMGYVERFECPSDRRSVVVKLSESGRVLRRSLDNDFNEIFDRIFEDIPDDEHEIFRKILCKITDKINNI